MPRPLSYYVLPPKPIVSQLMLTYVLSVDAELSQMPFENLDKSFQLNIFYPNVL